MAKKTQNKKKSSDKKETEATTASKWEKVAFLGVALFIVVVAIARVARVVVAYLDWGGSGVVKEPEQLSLEDNQLTPDNNEPTLNNEDNVKQIQDMYESTVSGHPDFAIAHDKNKFIKDWTKVLREEGIQSTKQQINNSFDEWVALKYYEYLLPDPPEESELSENPQEKIEKWIDQLTDDAKNHLISHLKYPKYLPGENETTIWKKYAWMIYKAHGLVGLEQTKRDFDKRFDEHINSIGIVYPDITTST